MNEKACTKCGETKALTEYHNRDGVLGKAPRCKPCVAEYKAIRYHDSSDGESQRDRSRRAHAEYKAWLWAQKDKPCMDCGIKYHPVAMDFDHLPGSVKLFEVAAYAGTRRRELIIAEMAKCELVCANCHRVRTYERKQA